MNHTAFFNLIKENRLASCYLFEGEEEYIKQSALSTLEKVLLPEGLEALNETVLENPSVSELMAAAETLPFMADKRLVVIKECGFLSTKGKDDAKEAERLADYIAALHDGVVLIFYVRGKVDARKKLAQKIKALDGVVTFAPLSGSELSRWMAKTLKPFGKTITMDVADYLAFTVGHDVMLLKGELEKLAAHAGERSDITRADIDMICSPSIECTVFELTDEMVAGNMAKAFTLLNRLLKTGSERIQVLQMVLRQYRILYHLVLMQKAGVGSGEMREVLGIPPFAVERAKRQARAYTQEKLQAAVALLVETDFKVKSGRANQEGALENVMLTLGTYVKQ